MTERRILYAPMSCQDHLDVGMQVFLETHRRVFGNNFGKLPKPLRDDAFSMGGYCLDAPTLMPCGSMVSEKFGPEDDDWIWVPTTEERP